MTALDEFLLARIAEEQDEARSGYSETIPLHLMDCATNGGPPGPFPCDCTGPARVLAECEAKRQIIELHGDDVEHYCPTGDDLSVYFNYLSGWAEAADNPQLCPTLRALALPYADHPDYREEWRP